MNNRYTITDFYLFLKLGLWKTGSVANWGSISNVLVYRKVNNSGFVSLGNKSLTQRDSPLVTKRPVSYYQNLLYPKKQLGIGIYLLDFYLLAKNNYNKESNYMMVISTCRSNLENKEYIYYLKVTNYLDILNFKAAIDNQETAQKRTSLFRRSISYRRPDTSPLHSVRRKY